MSRVVAVAIAVPVVLIIMGYLIVGCLLIAVLAGVTVLVVRSWWRRSAVGQAVRNRAADRKRRQYQGLAGFWDVRRHVRGAWKLTRKIAPGTPLMVLGHRSWHWFRQRVAVCRELSVLIIGPPGYWKSVTMACQAADAPALLFCTSTKHEIFLDTLAYRAGKGRIWTLNPDEYGGIPSTLGWDPLEDCEKARGAIRRAKDFAHAAPKNNDGNFWPDRAAELIAIMLHLAKITGQTMREARTWVLNPWDQAARVAAMQPGADPGLTRDLASLLASDPEHISSVISTAKGMLSWMQDEAIANAACPPSGQGFTTWGLARSHDSVYLIGEEDSLGPYSAAMATAVVRQLKKYAMERTSNRLKDAATFVLDEMVLTCPWDVHKVLAESRGYLITIIAGIQARSQLRGKWGEHDGSTIQSTSPVEVVLGGEKNPDDLEAVSRVVGDDADGGAVLPPEALNRLRKGKGLLFLPETKPVLADLPAIWQRPGHQKADVRWAAAWLAEQHAALHAEVVPAVTGPAPVRALAAAEEVSSCPDVPAAL